MNFFTKLRKLRMEHQVLEEQMESLVLENLEEELKKIVKSLPDYIESVGWQQYQNEHFYIDFEIEELYINKNIQMYDIYNNDNLIFSKLSRTLYDEITEESYVNSQFDSETYLKIEKFSNILGYAPLVLMQDLYGSATIHVSRTNIEVKR